MSEYDELINELLSGAPESWDGDEAASLTSLEQSHSAPGNREAGPATTAGVTPPEPAATRRKGGGGPGQDLMAALKESLDRARRRRES